MSKRTTLLFILLVNVTIFSIGCSESDTPNQAEKIAKENNLASVEENTEIGTQSNTIKPKYNYKILRRNITFGDATFPEVKWALTETDVLQLSNTMHALYSMRWHRGVYNLLFDLWHLNKDKYPELAWKTIEQTPVRIALASTISREQTIDTSEFQNFIRSYMDDENQSNLAQVVIALGLNGNPDDVEYIKTLASGSDQFVSNSAISSLAILNHDSAKEAMIELYEQNKENTKGDLLIGLLEKAYSWSPGNHE